MLTTLDRHRHASNFAELNLASIRLWDYFVLFNQQKRKKNARTVIEEGVWYEKYTDKDRRSS